MPRSTFQPDVERSLVPVQPFDLGQSLAFLRGFTPCAGDQICAPQSLTTGGYAGASPFLARVRPGDASDEDRSAGPVVELGDDPTAEVEDDDRATGVEDPAGAGAGTLSVGVSWLEDPGRPDDVATWLRGFLSLDDDLTGLYAAASTDPPFERVVEALSGYHHVRFPTPFEAACWAALSQRTPMALARRQKRDLVEACGRVEDVDGAQVSLFPTPTTLLAAAPAVREAVRNERKVKTILAAAEAFAGEDLAALDDDALRERLDVVWGFGDWSCEFVALRGFGRLAGVPRHERGLREAVAACYDLEDEAASDADLARLSEPYAPMQGYWAHYVRVWAFQRDHDD